MEKITKIGLVAGNGLVPLEIVRSCMARGIEVYVAGLSPWADEEMYRDVPFLAARVGEAGKILGFFKSHGVVELVLAGGLRRPSLKELIPDFEAVKILAKVAMKKMGDDGLLRSVVSEVEKRGFHILGVGDVVPEMLFQEGVYGRVRPSSEDMDDIRRGFEVARALGAVDVGQSVVIQEGVVLAVEAAEGTDEMIARAAALKKPGKAPVVVKVMKPGQDARVDLPTIGLKTIEQLAKYGMGGIAVEAGWILFVEREAAVAAADGAKVFLVSMEL